MANDVFANGREIACKAADGKAICAFPDVCFTPPTTPATPPGVPVPYPNSAFARDTTSGSKTIKISDKEVMLKNKSFFKKSVGDEAGCAPKKGVVTSKNMGKVYFNSWSMDVRFENQHVVRHLDLTTHNHASVPGDTPTWPYLDGMSPAKKAEMCGDEMKAVKDNCPNCEKSGKTHKDCPKYTKSPTHNKGYGEDPCVKAKRCMLVPYDRAKSKGGCCGAQTGHHLLPKHHFANFPKYDQASAPCVCAEGHSWHRNDSSRFPKAEKTHPMMHDIQDATERLYIEEGLDMHYDEAREIGIVSHKSVFRDSECSEKCMRAQLDAYHKQCGIKDDSSVNLETTGAAESPDNIDAVWDEMDAHCDTFFGN